MCVSRAKPVSLRVRRLQLFTMTVGVCVSGEAPRTFGLPCVGLALMQRIVIPLHADLFISANVKYESMINETRTLFQSTCDMAGVQPRMLHVYRYNRKHAATEHCTGDHQKQYLGRPQAEGFLDCYRQMEPLKYEWIILQRTDVYIPFTINHLPPAFSASTYRKVFVGFVSKMAWVDDRFAIIPGQLSQRAYLSSYASEFCNHPKCKGELCPAPEAKLFWTLDSENLTLVDIRYLCLHNLPADLQIIRGSCSETKKRWLHPYDKPPCKLEIRGAKTMKPVDTAVAARAVAARAEKALYEEMEARRTLDVLPLWMSDGTDDWQAR